MPPERFEARSGIVADRRTGADGRRWLVHLRCGAASRHLDWFDPEAARGWDFMVHYWEAPPTGFDPRAEIVACGGLGKFIGIGEIHEDHPGLFPGYNAILCLDDDLVIAHADIDRLFVLFDAFGLDLAQPSLTPDSFYSLRETLNFPGLKLRYTNWVECMAPVFSRRAFAACAGTFQLSLSNWGLDDIWPGLVRADDYRIGIIDAVKLRHTKPIDLENGPFYRFLAARGVDARTERRRIMAAYGIAERHVRILGAVPDDD